MKSDGSLWVMDNTYNNNHLPKQLVPGGVTAVAGASLFLKSDGSLWMSQGYSGVPLQIATGGVIAMAQGPGHLLFIKIDGSLWGMGNNGSGQLGDGTFNRANQPQMIVSGGVTAVAAGALHSLFRKNDGSLWAVMIMANLAMARAWPRIGLKRLCQLQQRRPSFPGSVGLVPASFCMGFTDRSAATTTYWSVPMSRDRSTNGARLRPMY